MTTSTIFATAQRVRTSIGYRRFAAPIAAAACFVISGCAASTPGPMATAAPSSAEITRDARLLQMADLRKLDTALVDELLSDNNASRRARTALAIGQVHGRARYAKLRQLLVDADTAVAATAAFALGLGSDTGAVVSLARAVAGAPDPVAIEAAWSLGDLGEPGRSVLTFALGEGTSQPLVGSTAAQRSAPVRAALIVAAAKLRPVPVAVLLPWLNDRDPQVVRATAYAFGRTRAPGAVRALIALRNSNDEETRQHVARALSKQAAGDSLGSRALDALNILVTDTSARVRVNAVRSLASYGAAERESLLRAMKDPDGNVRVATAEVLVPLLGNDAAVWKSLWAADSTLPVRMLLLTGARRIASNPLQAGEDEWRQSSDWRRRNAVLTARRADTAHAITLREVNWAMTDPDGRVREAGARVLNDVVRRDPAAGDSARKVWWSMLSDPDIQVKAAVLGLLRSSANADRLPLVLDAYTKSLGDHDNDVRIAALQFIASAWQRDSANITGVLRTRLGALAAPKDSAERAVVRNTTPMASWKVAALPTAPRPLSDYETLVRRYVSSNAKPITAVLHTERGDITLLLSGRAAPLTVDNFVQLARRGFYRNTYFHRVVPNFVAQDGDPRGDGSGGPGYAIRDEINRQVHTRGCLAMALSGPDTGGSQYYLCHSPQPHLDGHYTVFGHILQGFDVLDRIVQTDRILSIEIR